MVWICIRKQIFVFSITGDSDFIAKASMIEDLMIEQWFDVLFTPVRGIWIKASKT